MQRRFLKFILWTIVLGTVIITSLSGCSIYEAVDNRLHPTPQIDEEAKYFVERDENGNLNVNMTVSVKDAEMAMFYYFCRTDSGWDSEVEVGSDQVEEGTVQNSHVTSCNTELMVKVVAYHNYRKRSQRHNWVAWMINVEDFARI